MAVAVSRDQIIGFRSSRHCLDRRAPRSDLTEVAGRCGVQNTPPGAAGIALQARVHDLLADDVRLLLEEHRLLLQAFSLRGAPHVFPTDHLAEFTRALLPDDEQDLLEGVMRGARTGLLRLGLGAATLVDLVAAELVDVLDGAGSTKDDLGRLLGARLVDRLPAGVDPGVWCSTSPYAPRQSLGESLVRFALPVMSQRGLLCHGRRVGTTAQLCLTARWLPDQVPATDPVAARRGLLRRYLGCYGPSGPSHFARWAGIGERTAQTAWDLLADEMVEVDVGGVARWMLRDDMDALVRTYPPGGVRLLPPHDPYLQICDRELLVPDVAQRRRIWRATGAPGVAVAAGRPVAIWRPRSRGDRLDLLVEPLAPGPLKQRAAFIREAEATATHRGRRLGEVAGLSR